MVEHDMSVMLLKVHSNELLAITSAYAPAFSASLIVP